MKLPRRRRPDLDPRTGTPRGLQPGARGWRGVGGGAVPYLEAPALWRSTSVQVCGLWPFAAGTGSPMTGVPLGRLLAGGTGAVGATLCCDPVSWFQRAKLISTPIVTVIADPGVGKSTLVRRMALGLDGFGTIPLVLGDLRPDYVDLVRALGGQVIAIGRGRGHLNVLDAGVAKTAAARLRAAGHDKAAEQVLADARGRRAMMVAALITIVRGGPPRDREESIVDAALGVLDERPGTATLPGLRQVIRDKPAVVRAAAIDRGSDERYLALTEDLEASLSAMIAGAKFGDVFAAPTDEPMRLDRPVAYDVSSIPDSEPDFQAAALLACWAEGFAAVAVAQVLADYGLEPRRHYFAILDELWRVIRAGRGMVDRVDGITRLNRGLGVGVAMVLHSMKDPLSLADEADRNKARGFMERSGMIIAGGLSRAEMPLLSSVVELSRAEQDLLVAWKAPPAWGADSTGEAEVPGRGNFLVKVGGRPGLPFHLDLTTVEVDLRLNDTNRLWHTVSRIGRVADLPDAEVVEVAAAGAPVAVAVAVAVGA